ncbi:hypothetical protein [Streptomyces sp. 2A115]|uniref:hypothetical protein n=1 Tax=Streptomyces sp. 2A115 TaxID=3457439 RepID=UPI003FD36FC6
MIVHEAVPAPDGTIGTTLGVGTALDGLPSSVGFTTRATVASGSCHLDLRGAYPSGQGAYSYEGVTRAVATGTGDAVTAGGSAIVVARAPDDPADRAGPPRGVHRLGTGGSSACDRPCAQRVPGPWLLPVLDRCRRTAVGQAVTWPTASLMVGSGDRYAVVRGNAAKVCRSQRRREASSG